MDEPRSEHQPLPRTRRQGRNTVEVTPSPWQTEADIEEEFARSMDLADLLIEGGTVSWKAHFRWWGPVKVLAYKEVGPPPWRFPRIGVNRKGKTVRLIAGWRSTAFAVLLLWKRKPAQSGRSTDA